MRRTIFPVKPPKASKWPTPEHLSIEVDKYFESCLSRDYVKKRDMHGNFHWVEEVTQVRPYTMTGLALYIGVRRRTLLDFSHMEGKYQEIMERAKTRAEAYAEESLFSGRNASGAMFNLINNYKGWHNTRREEVSGRDGASLGISINDDRAKQARAQLLAQVEGI